MHDRLLSPDDLAEASKSGMSAYRAMLVRAGEQELRKRIEQRHRQAERDWELVVAATRRLKQLAASERRSDEQDLRGFPPWIASSMAEV